VNILWIGGGIFGVLRVDFTDLIVGSQQQHMLEIYLLKIMY